MAGTGSKDALASKVVLPHSLVVVVALCHNPYTLGLDRPPSVAACIASLLSGWIIATAALVVATMPYFAAAGDTFRWTC